MNTLFYIRCIYHYYYYYYFFTSDGMNCSQHVFFSNSFLVRKKNAFILSEIVKRKSCPLNHINHFHSLIRLHTRNVLFFFFGVNYVYRQLYRCLKSHRSFVLFSVCCMLPFRFSAYFNFNFPAECFIHTAEHGTKSHTNGILISDNTIHSTI